MITVTSGLAAGGGIGGVDDDGFGDFAAEATVSWGENATTHNDAESRLFMPRGVLLPSRSWGVTLGWVANIAFTVPVVVPPPAPPLLDVPPVPALVVPPPAPPPPLPSAVVGAARASSSPARRSAAMPATAAPVIVSITIFALIKRW